MRAPFLILAVTGAMAIPGGQAIAATDTTPPDVTRSPHPRLITGWGSLSMFVNVSWTANDPSGICEYRYQESFNGYWQELQSFDGSQTETTQTEGTGYPWQHRIQAVDCAGNSTDWVYGPTYDTVRVGADDSAISYAGPWTAGVVEGIELVNFARKAGATATYTFTGRSVGFVTTKSRYRGRVRISVDGVYVTTRDLYAKHFKSRVVPFVWNWRSSGPHTLTVEVVGTTGRPRVDVEGFEHLT